MGNITLGQAAKWCGGSVQEKYADISFFGANNDSRNILPGQLFVALQGARDGHDFIPAAMEKGAAAVLCSHCDEDYPAIVVENPRIALGQIAREERKRIGMKVVGVTGSVGKSTTKEMIACVLDGTYRVEKTPANHNNDIGMPMAILAMKEDTQVAVLEMGMNHFREIAYLTSIALPDVAVIINIGTMHIEHLGSREGIWKAKLEILEGMNAEGKVILNGDDNLLKDAYTKTELPVTYFATNNSNASVQAEKIHTKDGKLMFSACINGQKYPICLPIEGEHYVSDALAAIGVGVTMQITPEAMQERLSQFRNLAGRQEILNIKGYTIVKDCYNAGPESMAAALNVLGNQPGRRIAVLGDMLELGVCTQAEHYRIGRIAAEKAQIVLTYGPNSSRVVNGCLTGGMPEHRAMSFSDQDALVTTLKRLAKPGDVMLFKGSHGMRMDVALEKFLKEET